jgi:Predicted cobalamin binding protein
MSEILERIAYCIEFGKVNKATPVPPELKGQDGADELTSQALELGISPADILNSFVGAMDKVGRKFTENKVFVPQMLLSAKAMSTAMKHLRPYFLSGEVVRKGTFIIGTVAGDLHDIGKNLVAMMVEGAGWEVIDLGVDVKTEKFLEALSAHPNAVVGMSALLTTTMVNMGDSVSKLKEQKPDTKISIGGAPVNDEFRKKIGADFYGANAQNTVEYLNSLIA